MRPVSKRNSWDVVPRKGFFSLNYDAPHDFTSFSWQSEREHISGCFLIYRFAVAALFLALAVYCPTTFPKPTYWIIYLSHIGLGLQTIHLIISAAVPIQFLLLSKREPVTKMTSLAKLSWVLYNITNLLALVISFVFWIVLFSPEKGLKDRDVLVHGINVIMSLTDIFVSRRPCRMSHFFHSAGVIIPYFVFSLIYWAAGGRRENGLSYLYPVLNWDNLSVTMPCVTVGLVVGLPTVHGAMWALHWLRDRTISFTNQCKFNQQEVYGGQWDRTSSLQEDSTSSTTDSSTKTTLEKV